ncbi:hypothetical protein OROMI_002841 [Orobanche minor]
MVSISDFAYNLLRGTIPEEWDSTRLQFISVLVNRLSGEIPKGLGNISSLTYLPSIRNLEGNQFSGDIPPNIGKLRNLKTLILSSNQLEGSLPLSFSNLTNLNDFRINDNKLSGIIPDLIQNWRQLIKLNACKWTGWRYPLKHISSGYVAGLCGMLRPEEPVIRPESLKSILRKERFGHHTVFIHDAFSALHKVGKALDKLNLSAAEEILGVISDLFNIANALQVLPRLIKVASGTKLTGHDKNLNNLSLSLQTLANKFNKIKGKQDDVMDLVHSINSHLNDVFDDSIAAAINRLGIPHQGYRVSGPRPEFHDPSVPWKQLQWKKTQLMRYFVKLNRESTIFDRCKTLSEAANDFTARLEKGVLPLQLAMLSKHKKVTGLPTQKTGFFHTTSRTKEWPFIRTEAKTLS